MRPRAWLSRRGDDRSVDRAVEAFEAGLASGRTTLDRFWDGLGSDRSPSTLASLVKVDLWRRFEAGGRPRVLDYLGRYPALAEDSDRVVSLVYEEFCLLQECGEDPDSRAFCSDYAPWRESLASQLAYHRELSRAVGQVASEVKFPEPGELFDRYRLRSLLGSGGVGRVYLATEERLGGRRVVIKVTAAFGQEPAILAGLDHRNIVPILTVAESASGLRGICMPYRPGRTLEDLIARLGRGKPPRTARAIIESLGSLGRPDLAPGEDPDSGWADFPSHRTFPEAVAWIGQRLARALAYLHKRGIFHRDIKPANILLAHVEGPQLLDFNLAKDPNSPEGASAAHRGGTLPYMAPEQLVAFLDPSAWTAVGEAADLYSLGLVLRELLTGRGPELPVSRGSLPREIRWVLDRRLVPFEPIREINPGVPPALESIIGKCLALHPADRYRHAGELEVDLRRFLERKPLIGAPNPSNLERWVNCIYRNRRGVFPAVLLASSLPLLALFNGDESGLAAFARAEAFLDSGAEGDLLRARAAFEALQRDRPNTARSSLGLAMTLLKLDKHNTGPINDLVREAARRPDAEEALDERLAKEPDSGTLMRTLGHVLIEKGSYDRARVVLERSLRIDPEAIAGLTLMAILEQKTGHDQGSLGHLDRAIDLAIRKKVGPTTIYQLRKPRLITLVRLIDREIATGNLAGGKAEAARLLGLLKAGLAGFDEDHQQGAGQINADEHAFTREYLRGCSASIDGALLAEPEGSALLFRQAEGRFKAARVALARTSGTREGLALVLIQEKTLDERHRTLAVGP